MSLPRFFTDALKLGLVVLDEAESRHALASLRLHPGDEAVLFDGRGRWASAVLQPSAPAEKRNARRLAVFQIGEIQTEPPLVPTLTLIVVACKGPRLSWMIEKLTELGATRVILADFERSVVRVSGGHTDKLRRTALEAAKQCQRAWLPEIVAGISLSSATEIPPSNSLPSQGGAGGGSPSNSPPSQGGARGGSSSPRLLIAHPDPRAASAADEIRAVVADRVDLRVVIGPEGGLTDAELSRLTAAGGRPIRLAPHILRIETAAIAVAATWASQL